MKHKLYYPVVGGAGECENCGKQNPDRDEDCKMSDSVIQKCAYKPDCECDGYHCVGCADDLCEHVCAELARLEERVEELERIESSLTMLANQKDGCIKELEAVAEAAKLWNGRPLNVTKALEKAEDLND